MGLFQKIKPATLEEEKEIFKERFSDLGMPIEFKEIDYEGWARILFHCDNIQQYVEKSREIERIIENEFSCGSPSSSRRTRKFKMNTLRFLLDHLTIDGVRDSYYDYRAGGGMLGFIVKPSYTVAVRRRDLVLSDNSGKILSYVELHSRSPDDKTWSTIMFSEKGDEVRVKVYSLEKKENEEDINHCQLTKMRNYSLEARLKK